MDDKVQLSRETIVGDDVVNEDIYPNTNTKSVNDDQSGTSLNETIERLWAAINNKVSRNVNSVNGRSGIVVLDSSDVGLENVDNISFNDIKTWVLDELSKVFDYKKIKLFSNKSDLVACINNNNLNDAFAPFYVECWDADNDMRPHIGCIVIDPNDSYRLAYNTKPISGVGATDYSLTYKNTDTDDGTGRKGGDLRVKISSSEDALYVNTIGTDEQKGLRIDKHSIGGVFHFYNGIYGDPVEIPEHPGSYTYENGLLALTQGENPVCTISIDGHVFENTYPLADTSIHQDDTLVCNFMDYRSTNNAYVTLKSEYQYINLDPYETGTLDWSNSGDGYRVGDVIDLDGVGYTAKFIVTSIKDGMYEGPVASVNLLYCDAINSGTGVSSRFYDTKPVIRYMVPSDENYGYPDPVDLGVGSENYVSIQNTSTASGCRIYIDIVESWTGKQYTIPDGMEFKFMLRGMCIGCVRSAPTRTSPTNPYVIEFNSVRPLIGNSLQYKTYDKQFHSDKFSDVIDIRTRKGHVNGYGLWNEMVDVSGLVVAENWGEYREDGKPARILDGSGDTMVEPNRMKRVAVLPGGVTDVMPNSQSSTGGVSVMTDMSLCLIPHELCAPLTSNSNDQRASQYAVNWAASVPYIFPTYEKDPPSYVGINLFKVIKQRSYRNEPSPRDCFVDQKYLINLSGLRVVGRWDKLNKSMFGKTGSETYLNTPDGVAIETEMENYPVSGGLMVNVGRGLEIRGWYDSDEDTEDYDSFIESGKVCARVDERTITINEDNRIAAKLGRGLTRWRIDPSDVNSTCIAANVDDKTIVFTNDTENGALSVNINQHMYHDIDMMSNKHAVINGLTSTTPTGDDVGLSVYVDTKFGLGFTISGNTTGTGSAPNALIIRTKAADVGKEESVYRSKVVALDNDSLMFDPDGRLISPIDNTRGLENTYTIKAVSSDSCGNVTAQESGGIAIKAGPGLTFNKDGQLTLEADYEIKALKNGFDLNNLVTGNYYAKSDISDTISNRPADSLGVFRIEHKPVIPEENYYIQKLYSFEKRGIVYMRYKMGTAWTAWYHIDGTIID